MGCSSWEWSAVIVICWRNGWWLVGWSVLLSPMGAIERRIRVSSKYIIPVLLQLIVTPTQALRERLAVRPPATQRVALVTKRVNAIRVLHYSLLSRLTPPANVDSPPATC